ncbi:MAG: TerB family tellurite resistance protein [Deltaproteobacteria bacterium]|nr:TerB family tellurite resistance protein [Deltaproteobacteria bacterium]
MSIIGKLVGGAIGFALGGPIGAIAGAVFGHAFDNKPADSDTAMSLSYGESSQITFFVAAFSMLGKLARTDGQISRAEMDAVRQFMTYDLNLSPESQQVAINIFLTAQESPESFESFASQFYGQFHVQPQMLELMMDILLRVSVSDGGINPSEERLIQSAASIFGFNSAQYAGMRSRYARDVNKYYAVLGCTHSDTDEQIKKQYRKLVVSEYHPDKIIAKGLPDEFIKFANDKFKEIQEAYEAVKKERGII